MSEIKLLPCPFCGGEAKIESISNSIGDILLVGYKVKCTQCYASTLPNNYTGDKQEAIKRWNTRKPMERIAEQIEFLEHRTIDGVPYVNMNDAIEIVKEEGGIE